MDDDLLAEGKPGSPRAEMRFFAIAAVAGALAGLVGSLFHRLIDIAITWPDWLGKHLDGWALVAAASVVTMACAVGSVAIVRRVAPEASGSGVQEIEGAMEGLRPVRWRRVLPVKFVAGLMAIGSGLVLGREGPTIHLGASVSAALAEYCRTSELERRGLLASGAAAGLACAFNAPISGALFVIEETHKEFPYTFRTYAGVLIAAVTSTIVTQMIAGSAPAMPLAAGTVALALLPAFLILGALLGVLGTALNASILRMLDVSARVHARAPFAYPAAVGLAVGALFILMPGTVTGGERVILDLAGDHPGLVVLLALAAIRFATMVGSYTSGAPGGIFAPILALAVSVGLAFGEVAQRLMPDAGFAPATFAIAAMGGLFTASVRAPLVGVVLTLELTGAYILALPLMVTCVAADVCAQWCGGRPIYSQLLDRTLAAANVPAPPDRRPTGLA